MGFAFIMMIVFYSLVKVEIYNIKTNETRFYFKKDNLKGAYIYNPDNICYKFAYNHSLRLIFLKGLNKLQRVSFDTDLKFSYYMEFIYKNLDLSNRDTSIDIYIKKCN